MNTDATPRAGLLERIVAAAIAHRWLMLLLTGALVLIGA